MLFVYFLIVLIIYITTNSENFVLDQLKSDEFNEFRKITDDNVYFPMILLYGKNDSDFVQIGGTNSSITQNFTIKISHFYSPLDFFIYRCIKMAVILVIEVSKTQTDDICDLKNDIYMDEYRNENIFKTSICDELTYATNKAYGKYVNFISNAQFFVHINLKNFRGSVKITATATRNNKIGCKRKAEIPCQIKGQTWCLNKKLTCNGQLNCGDRKQIDENPEICQMSNNSTNSSNNNHQAAAYSGLVVMALYGIIVVISMVFILVQVLRICLHYGYIPSKDRILSLDRESQLQPPPPQYSETFTIKTKRNLEMIHPR